MQEAIARLLAAAAGFGADAAMLHAVLPVFCTLVAAELARLGARLEGRAEHRRIAGRLARHNPAYGGAEVGAVEVEVDTADEHLRVLLSEAGVGAGRTRLGAVEARLDASCQRRQVEGRLTRARLAICSA